MFLALGGLAWLPLLGFEFGVVAQGDVLFDDEALVYAWVLQQFWLDLTFKPGWA